MLLLEKVRMEIYLPDLPVNSYSDLLETFETEFTYTFGGCTIVRGLDGRYLSRTGLDYSRPNQLDLYRFTAYFIRQFGNHYKICRNAKANSFRCFGRRSDFGFGVAGFSRNVAL